MSIENIILSTIYNNMSDKIIKDTITNTIYHFGKYKIGYTVNIGNTITGNYQVYDENDRLILESNTLKSLIKTFIFKFPDITEENIKEYDRLYKEKQMTFDEIIRMDNNGEDITIIIEEYREKIKALYQFSSRIGIN